jgi:hypothetical protein
VTLAFLVGVAVAIVLAVTAAAGYAIDRDAERRDPPATTKEPDGPY